MPTLRIISGPHNGQQFFLKDGSVEIGRDPACAIPLEQDTGISRHHARLDVANGRVTVHDLGSSNGLFVNEGRTASTILQPGDKIQLGNSIFMVDADPAPAPVAVPPAAPIYAPSPATTASGTPYAGFPSPAAGMPNAAMDPGQAYGSGSSGYKPRNSGVPNVKWLYFMAFSIPPIGLIYGVLYLRKDLPDEKRAGWWIIIWSVIGAVLTWWSYVEIMKLWHMAQALSPLSGSGGIGGLLGGDG